ncbi:hypothetical protein [Streptomyces sp. NBC_00347]|uniref:hypothetical protein n=1 Tax=Streptomyces sp. NBC_00347 TaxID=2975721 RepID=UPI0022546BA3|nr:hypothetical protein [Streptomyces sp. NBC_00347]MCX5129264.1 hypothetical protein [Streptomyces sp. NBC_00347]
MADGQDDGQELEPDRGDAAVAVHRLQQGLAVAGAVVSLPVVVWGLQQMVGGLFVVTWLCAAVPLLFLRAPKGFVGACVTTGLLLLGWGVLGALAGMFLFWPSALLLLCAAFADPRRRPVAAKVAGGFGAVVAAAVVVGCAVFAWQFYLTPALAEPHSYRAETTHESLQGLFRDEGATVRLKRLGATSVSGSESDEGAYLVVSFPDGLSLPEREGLKSEIARLPGIAGVGLCPVSECG